MTTKVTDQRGLAKQVKRILPRQVFRALTRTYNAVVSRLPYGVKYALGESVRRGKVPYSLIADGDLVVQIGAPRDLLAAGRSRAVHFARLVKSGKVVVIEPDPDNVRALEQFIAANRLERCMVLVPLGAWNTSGELRFLSSPDHPASNQLVAVAEQRPDLGPCVEHIVPVDTVDNILQRLGLSHPKLVSITTNGAEMQIVEGMQQTIASGCDYISLAASVDQYHTALAQHGYKYIVRDDRGACYQQIAAG